MIYDEEPEFQFWRLLSRISPSRHRVHKQERQLTRRVSSSEKPELFIVSRTWYRKIFSWNNQSLCSGWKTATFLLHMLKTSIENNLLNSERPRCYQAPNRRHHPANRKARWTKGCPFPKRGGGGASQHICEACRHVLPEICDRTFTEETDIHLFPLVYFYFQRCYLFELLSYFLKWIHLLKC